MEEVYRRQFQRGAKRWRERRATITQLVPHTGAVGSRSWAPSGQD